MKKIISALLLVLCMTVCLCACNEVPQPSQDSVTTTTAEEVTTTTQAPAAVFEVKIVDQDGNPVKGVMTQICKDICIPKLTDENGIAAYELEITDGYKLSVLSCPTGYIYKGAPDLPLESGSTSYTVEVQKEA